jgi:hypothetical protein
MTESLLGVRQITLERVNDVPTARMTTNVFCEVTRKQKEPVTESAAGRSRAEGINEREPVDFVATRFHLLGEFYVDSRSSELAVPWHGKSH